MVKTEAELIEFRNEVALHMHHGKNHRYSCGWSSMILVNYSFVSSIWSADNGWGLRLGSRNYTIHEYMDRHRRDMPIEERLVLELKYG